MEQKSLDRVREDLATMKAAMGDPAFGSVDVGFYIALSVAAGIFAVSHASGAQSGWLLWLSQLPAIGIFIAYMSYLAVKSHRNSDVNLTRRQEYRTTLMVLPPVVLVSLAARHWAAQAGMSHLQFGGVFLVATGCGLAVMGLTNIRPARYPRAYLFAVGFPSIAAGLLCPFCTMTQGKIVVGGMGSVIFALAALAIHYHLRRQYEGTMDATD